MDWIPASIFSRADELPEWTAMFGGLKPRSANSFFDPKDAIVAGPSFIVGEVVTQTQLFDP